jgi:hypothetical protein
VRSSNDSSVLNVTFDWAGTPDTRKALAVAVFEWIEAWYNPTRRRPGFGVWGGGRASLGRRLPDGR